MSTTPSPSPLTAPLLEIRNLRTWFHLDEGISRAVDGVSYTIHPGRTLGLVGESGSGKSVSSLSILRLIPQPPGRIHEGSQILFEGTSLLDLPEAEMRKIRGNRISMIFQEPMTSLNPVFTVGDQIMEAILLHDHGDKAAARTRAIELLAAVRIPVPELRIDEYPHQLSGGMRQRVMIAMALACRPKLLIADEPTTALDVTIQAQILELLRDLQKQFGMSILIITHDLGVVAETADHVAVMYAGRVVEYGTVPTIFARPRHPYTLGLFRSRPSLDRKKDKLDVIPGTVPNPLNFPPGCRFHPRCPFVQDRCRTEEPTLREIAPGRLSACHFAETIGETFGGMQAV